MVVGIRVRVWVRVRGLCSGFRSVRVRVRVRDGIMVKVKVRIRVRVTLLSIRLHQKKHIQKKKSLKWN
jgi:hypothetical protein